MQKFTDNRWYRHYVSMLVKIDKSGQIMPVAILWDDGHRYPIDRIIHIRQAAAQTGGSGIRYTCRIHGQLRNLYHEIQRNQWFLESQKP